MTDPQELADQAVSSFDLSDYAAGAATAPTDTVTVYLDAQTAYEIESLKQRHDEWVRRTKNQPGPKSIADEGDTELEEIDVKIEAAKERIKSSGLTFHLRAVGPVERDAIGNRIIAKNPIDKNLPEEERQRLQQQRTNLITEAWLAAAVVKIVRDSDGAVDSGKKTQEDIAKFRAVLYETEYDRLREAFANLTWADALFDRATDAGFRGGETVGAE